MSGEVSLYEVLGVAEGASEEELRRARKRALKRWHPDRNRERPEAATAKTVAIQEAFSELVEMRRRSTSGPASTTTTCGGWLRGVDVDTPNWRPPTWSWVGADPIRELHRHREFFVSQLRDLPDDEAVMLTTVYRGAAVLVTDRRLTWIEGRFRRRIKALRVKDMLRLSVVGNDFECVVTITSTRGTRRLCLPTPLGEAVATRIIP